MRKRMLGFAICMVMLITILCGAMTVSASQNDTIRVKLTMGSQTSIPFYMDGNYRIDEDHAIVLDRQLYTVKLEDGILKLYLGSTMLYSGIEITLKQGAPTEGLNNFIWINNQRYGYASYLGDFIFVINDGRIDVINRLYLEDYLYGVVPYEMSNSWPAEALRAQAVAARSYAYSFLGGSGSYDVGDTSSDQVYKGYNASYTNAIDAVNDTARQVAAFDGNPVCTYFSASNGGWTEIPLHAWSGGSDVPYYQIIEDSYDISNPSSLYETVFFPISIDAQHPITVSGNVDGTPDAANAVAYIKHEIVKSGKLSGLGVVSADDFELKGVTALAAHTPDTDNAYHDRVSAYSSIECVDYIMATGSFTVEIDDASAIAEDVVLDLRYFDASNDIITYKVFNKDSLRLFVVEQVTDGETIIGFSISQKRYGHGIGLSQRGAQQRANEGQGYEDIISFYYPGTTLLELSITRPALPVVDIDSRMNATVVNVSKSVNVRSGPSASDALVGTLPKGARMHVTRLVGAAEWYEINYGGTNAYVSADYVALDNDYINTVVDGKLRHIYYDPDGTIKKLVIYHGTTTLSGVYKINYYTDGVRTSYKLYNESGRLTNMVELYSNGKPKKVNYYSGGIRKAYKLYDTEGRMTHYIYTYEDGVKPQKTNYFDISTGIRTHYKLYDTDGRTTHYAECYDDGIKAKKLNYYSETGIRTAYKTYREDGSTICRVQCDSEGQPYKGTYYDKKGNVTKVVYY